MKNYESLIIEDIFFLDAGNKSETNLAQQCFDIVGVFVAAVDLSGNITLINNKTREILGYEEDELIGKNFIQNFVEEERKKETDLKFRKVLKGEYHDSIRYHLVTKNGSTKIIEARNLLIHDKHNKILGILISGEDVTTYLINEDELKKDINLYQILARNIPGIILFMFDKDMRFQIAEGIEMENIGLKKDYFVGKYLHQIDNEVLSNIFYPLLKSCLAGRKISSEYKYKNNEYLIKVIPLRNEDGIVIGGIAITQNITGPREIALNLEKSKDLAEKANQAKSKFLASVSHEIRTPLNAIIGFTEQLNQTMLTRKQDEYVNIIEKSAEHLLSLVSDILVITKIEAQELRFDKTPFKIKDTVEYVTQMLQYKATEKNLTLNYTIDQNLNRIILGDAFRLRQILVNLVNNAIKFTHQGSVEIRSFIQEESKKEVMVKFEIIDTGIGIKSEDLNSIFEQFKQADSSVTKKYGGTGLGLTICKNLIELQNGTLSVVSRENEGSTFYFVIPYDKAGSENLIVKKEVEKVDDKILKDIHVLLVDDDSVNRLLGKTILGKLNCKVDIASGGKEAISKIDNNKYDLILLDIYMPEVSGLDVMKYLRETKGDKSTKVIAVTASVMKADRIRYQQAGINNILVKPFREINLFNKICEVLNISVRADEETEQARINNQRMPLYDLTDLKKIAENDNQFIKSMLDTSVRNSESALKDFHRLLSQKNWKQIGETAHKILPSYRHLKIKRVEEELIRLKTATLIKHNYKIVPRLIEDITNSMNLVISELKNEIAKR